MTEIDIQVDLKAVNEQINKMVEELNKISTVRDQMLQQLQNMNGVAMYLRGKLPPEEQAPVGEKIVQESNITTTEDDITRTVEYP